MKFLKQIINESIQLLLEYDREKTWKIHGDKVKKQAENDFITGREHPVLNTIMGQSPIGTISDFPSIDDPEVSERAKLHLTKHLEDTDPTPHKKYVQHIARIYGSGGVHFEDLHSRMTPALETFHNLSTRKIIPQDQRDIGKIKTLSDLEDIVDEHSDKLSSKQENAAYHEEMKKQASITDHATFTHIIPHTEEASRHFGKGTRWCTAAKNNSMFNSYNERGKLHIYTPKEPKYHGEKYQAYFDGNDKQVMDEKDHEIESYELESRHPDISKHINDHIQDSLHASESLRGLIHHEPWVRLMAYRNLDNIPPESIHHTLEHESNSTIKLAASSHLPHDDKRAYDIAMQHLDAASKYNDPFHGYDITTYSSKAHPQHLDALVDHLNNHAGAVNSMLSDVIKHPNTMDSTIDKIVNSKNPDISKSALHNIERLTPEHLETLSNHPHENVSKLAKHILDKMKSGEYTKPKPKKSQIKWHGR